MVPLMRAAGQVGAHIQARPSQYAATALLYHVDAPWLTLPILDVTARIRDLLPPTLHDGWALLNRGRITGAEEASAARAAEWIGRHGEQHGFRTLDPQERGRATGCGAYLEGLALDSRDLYDAQGTYQDRAAIGCRLSQYLRAWVCGERIPAGSQPLDVPGLERVYQRVRATVEDAGIPAQATGVPADVQRAAALAWAPISGADAPDPAVAAEDGRGAL